MNLLFILAAAGVGIFILAIYACVRIAAEKDSPPPIPPTPPDKGDCVRVPAEEPRDPQSEYYKTLWALIFDRVKATLAENDEVLDFEGETTLIGTTSDTVKALLLGADKPGLYELIAFADEYGVSIDYLLGRKETSWVQ